jgi:hypothetical protein
MSYSGNSSSYYGNTYSYSGSSSYQSDGVCPISKLNGAYGSGSSNTDLAPFFASTGTGNTNTSFGSSYGFGYN